MQEILGLKGFMTTLATRTSRPSCGTKRSRGLQRTGMDTNEAEEARENALLWKLLRGLVRRYGLWPTTHGWSISEATELTQRS
jgi:hypothetical protein